MPCHAVLSPCPRQVVDHHFDIRQRAAEQRKRLEDRAVQFRNIEKRLLMRFKVIIEDEIFLCSSEGNIIDYVSLLCWKPLMFFFSDE